MTINMKRIVEIGKKSMLYILCLVMVLGLISCAKDDAVKNFNTLAGEVKQQQNAILNKITESEALLSTTNAKDLADPKILDRLKSEIDSAKKFSVVVPDIASKTDEIKQQIQDLTTKKSESQKQLDSLSSAVSAIKDSRQKLIDQIAAEKEAKLQEAITPKDTYSITATDDNGNKQKITISIGKWIKGSESELLDKAWKKVGGSGSMPLTSSYGGSEGAIGGTFHPKDAAYVFGTVELTNMTPDFSAKNFSNGRSWVYLIPQIHFDQFLTNWNWHELWYEGFGKVVQGRQYSSVTSCDLVSADNPLVRADMTQNKWGPAPFVMGVETVFSPNFPQGNPKLNDVDFFLSSSALIKINGDTKFKIGKSW